MWRLGRVENSRDRGPRAARGDGPEPDDAPVLGGRSLAAPGGHPDAALGGGPAGRAVAAGPLAAPSPHRRRFRPSPVGTSPGSRRRDHDWADVPPGKVDSSPDRRLTDDGAPESSPQRRRCREGEGREGDDLDAGRGLRPGRPRPGAASHARLTKERRPHAPQPSAPLRAGGPAQVARIRPSRDSARPVSRQAAGEDLLEHERPMLGPGVGRRWPVVAFHAPEGDKVAGRLARTESLADDTASPGGVDAGMARRVCSGPVEQVARHVLRPEA